MRRRDLLAAVAVPLLLWIGHTLFTRPTLEPTGDFLTFVAAGRGIGAVDIYADRDMAELWRREFNRPYTNRYIYPPVFAAVMSRVAHRDLDTLFRDATTLNLALIPVLAGLLTLLLTQLVPRAGPLRAAGLVFAALSVNVPLLRTLAFTQVNLAVTCVVLIALVTLRRPPIAGTALAVAASIKIAPAVLVAPLVTGRRWQGLVAFIVVTGALVAMTALAFGMEPWSGFVRYTLTHPGMPVAWNTSIDSLVFLGAGVPPMEAETSPLRGLVLLLKIGVALAAVGLGWRGGCFRSREGLADDMLFLLPVMLLVSPYAWPHGHLFVLPTMLVVVIRTWTADRNLGRLLAIGATYAVIFWMPVVSTYPWAFLRAVGVAALLFLMASSRPRSEPERI